MWSDVTCVFSVPDIYLVKIFVGRKWRFCTWNDVGIWSRAELDVCFSPKAIPRPSRATWRKVMNQNGLPHFATGKVVKGFGRGSKELGIPTANFDEEVVNRLPDSVETGVYFGWAQVDDGPVYKMVMSIGWNPFYKNTKKSMETHVLHEFPDDFYGAILKVLILERIRPEMNFNSVDELIAMIKNDIAVAEAELERSDLLARRNSPLFSLGV